MLSKLILATLLPFALVAAGYSEVKQLEPIEPATAQRVALTGNPQKIRGNKAASMAARARLFADRLSVGETGVFQDRYFNIVSIVDGSNLICRRHEIRFSKPRRLARSS